MSARMPLAVRAAAVASSTANMSGLGIFGFLEHRFVAFKALREGAWTERFRFVEHCFGSSVAVVKNPCPCHCAAHPGRQKRMLFYPLHGSFQECFAFRDHIADDLSGWLDLVTSAQDSPSHEAAVLAVAFFDSFAQRTGAH